MKELIKFLFLTGIVLLFLTAGVLLGITLALASETEGTSPIPSEENLPAYTRSDAPKGIVENKPAASGQENTLVLLVDRLDVPQPNLIAAWLVLYVPSRPGRTLVPMYPSGVEGGPADDSFLEQMLLLDETGAPAAEFFVALQEQDLWWHHYLVADEIAAVEAVNLLEGSGERPDLTTGHVAIFGLPRPWQNKEAAVKAQIDLLAQLCQPAPAVVDLRSAPTSLIMMREHVRTDLDLLQIMLDWQGLRGAGGVGCKFPSLERNPTP